MTSIEELLLALNAFQAALVAEQGALQEVEHALVAEQGAKALREEKGQAFLDALATFRGGLPAADVDALAAQLQAHAAKLEALAK